jgi:nicotinate phosphoribosyltransferase
MNQTKQDKESLISGHSSLALLTDYYQLTMAYAYWKAGKAEEEAIFNLFFRKHPFQGGYTITCGQSYVMDFLRNFSFAKEDLDFIALQTNDQGKPVFEKAFIEYLENLKFNCEVFGMPEGTLAFPNEPILRVRGPILQCQLLETPLLNIINFQSLIATKSARVNYAAQGDTVMEFGLRRAQGIDGGLAASRAAYIGGCSSTSNVLAGKLFGIPVAGTHAHSWVMSFPDEKEAFEAYAAALPDNCVFLVDTYHTFDGTRKAIQVGKELRKQGKKLHGIRIDSGDLAYFSSKARQLLDSEGLHDTKIIASNDLDEYIIHSLKAEQKAPIDIWGVGTKLVTAFDQPALGAVYKLSAIRNEQGVWEDKIKLSEQAIKVNTPGLQQVRRYFNNSGDMIGDMIFDENLTPPTNPTMVDPMDSTRRKKMKSADSHYKDLLIPIFRDGKQVESLSPISQTRDYVKQQMNQLDNSTKRLVNPHIYPVGLEQQLHDKKMRLILSLRAVH